MSKIILWEQYKDISCVFVDGEHLTTANIRHQISNDVEPQLMDTEVYSPIAYALVYNFKSNKRYW